MDANELISWRKPPAWHLASLSRALLLLNLKLDKAQSAQRENALQHLTSLGLVEIERDGAARLHKLLAAFVRRLNPSADYAEVVVGAWLYEAWRINRAGYPGPLLA